MNRRETILAAILVNAGLLVVLFVSALKTEEMPKQARPQKVAHVEAVQKPVKAVKVKQEKKVAAVNTPKIEAVLEKFSKEKLAESSVKTVQKKASVAKSGRSITVAKGDVLDKIARRNHVSTAALKELNALKSDVLQIGQVLYLPEEAIQKMPQVQENHEYYVVKSGDNPWTIALKNNIRVNDLLRLNNLDDKQAKKLKPGDKLIIK